MGFELVPAPTRDVFWIDVVSSVFIYDMGALIARLQGCLLDCFDWELNCCVVVVH